MIALRLLAQSWLVVIGGLGGEPRYSAAFQEQAQQLRQTAESRLGIPADRIVYLSEFTTPEVSKDAIAAALAGVAARAAPDAIVTIVLLGHGSARGGRARFHLPGPDLTPADLDALLDGFGARELLVVNAASASGPWLDVLAGPHRTIVTATRSGVERNETVFGRYFIEALGSEQADADRNGRTSVLEAFTFTRREVARHYEQERRLATEHALLDDDGDGRGTLEPAADGNADGPRAAALYLAAATPAGDDPALTALVARRDSLDRALAALRATQDTLAPDVYAERLETLLLEVARVGRAIRERQEPETP